MKKKLLAILLTGTMLFTMSGTAFAAYAPKGEGAGATSDTNGTNNITLDTVKSWDKADEKDGQADAFAGQADTEYPIGASQIKNIDVLGTSSANDKTHVIAVSVDRTQLAFTYAGASYIWDPVALKYVEPESPGAPDWDTQTLNVINYSDRAIKVKAEYTPVSGAGNGITLKNISPATTAGAVDDGQDTLDLNSAYVPGNSTGTERQGSFTVTLQGAPQNLVLDTQAKIGTLKLTLTVPAE